MPKKEVRTIVSFILVYILIALLVLLPNLRFMPYGFGDGAFGYVYEDYLQKYSLSVWTNHLLPYGGYNILAGNLYFYLLGLIPNFQLRQFVFLFMTLFLSLLFSHLFFSKILKKPYYILLASLFYNFSNIVLYHFWLKIQASLFAVMVTPLLMYLLVCLAKKRPDREIALLCLLTSFTLSTFGIFQLIVPFLYVFIFVAIFFIGFSWLFKKNLELIQYIRFLLYMFLLLAPMIFSLFIGGLGHYNVATEQINFSRAFRDISVFYGYKNILGLSVRLPYSIKTEGLPALQQVVIGFSYILLIYHTVKDKLWHGEKNSYFRVFAVLFLGLLFVSLGALDPLGVTKERVFNFLPFGDMFRNVYEKCSLLLLLTFTTLFFGLLERKSMVLTILPAMLTVYYMYVFASGALFSSKYILGDIRGEAVVASKSVDLPKSYIETRKYLISDLSYRIKVLPETPKNDHISYLWGNKIVSGADNHMLLFRALTTGSCIQELGCFSAMSDPIKLLYPLSVKQIILRKDVYIPFGNYGKSLPTNPAVIEEYLDSVAGLSVIYENSDIKLYQLEERSVPKILSSPKCLVSREVYFTSTTNTLSTVFTEDALNEIGCLDVRSSLVRDVRENGGVIEIDTAGNSVFVVYNVGFQPLWYIGGTLSYLLRYNRYREMQEHFKVNGYANGWSVDVDKYCELNKKYCSHNSDGSIHLVVPVRNITQLIFTILIFVSILFHLLLLILLIFYKKTDRVFGCHKLV